MSVNDWSTTAADNTTVGAVSIAEGMMPSGVNNAIREMMAELKVYFDASGTPLTAADIGVTVQAFDADLSALAGLASNGMVARTGAGTAAVRTITGTASKITVTNGDGVAGDPTLTLPSTVEITTSIELGHATDTTLSRSAAGVMAVEGNVVPSPASQATGDILYRGASEWARLAAGTNTHVLTLAGGVPSWAAPAAGGQPIPTSATFAVGSVIFAQNGGGSVAALATSAGGNIFPAEGTSAGVLRAGAGQTGTWQNISGGTLATSEYGYWVRTA